MHTHWQVIRLSDRMQAKPFSVFIHLPHYTISPSLYAIILRCSEQWQEAPGAPKPVAQWQLTFDGLSQRHHHTTIVCFHSSSVSMRLLHSLFLFFFNFVSVHPTALCDSGCWLKQSPLKLAVPVSPVFGFDPKARDLHQGVECLQPPQRIFWRMASRPLCDGPMS